MLTLGAWLEAGQAMFDAVIQPLVVTSLEVQAVELLGTAPVATVQAVRAHQAEGGRDDIAIVLG